ncbi:MAG TPA: glycerophosphodiester phosphodiesterase [Bryobacteraceae bacterium]|jgi:glycerophosphoryl diester phosphodiesterase|nr:glycerophosphodiester phosphodiesterase [Bryobacteraceae bacterium]
MPPAIICHRGLCRATARSRRRAENTIAAFREGIAALCELGFPPSIEFDVRRSADRRLVVIHDPTLRRTAGVRGRVSRHTAAELADFGIPLLADVLDRFSGVEFHVEIKEPGLARDVKNLILGRRLQDRTIVSSFDWRELAQLAPEVRFALTSSLPTRRTVRLAAEMGACAIHPAHRRTNRVLVEAAHAAGLRVHAWTVNTPAAYRRLERLGVDAVFSDNPRLLAGLQ